MKLRWSNKGGTVIWLLSIPAVWLATAWLARRAEPWAIDLTNPAFTAALVWTYVAAWRVVVMRSARPRIALLRAGAVTISLLLCVFILEVPAIVGLIDYSRLRGVISEEWSGPEAGFIDDPDFSFRRPPNSHWSWHPRSNMAQLFNLPTPASYQQTFSTDNRGFRNPATLDRADIALVGDSYIEGAYVSDEETVAVRLHELTGRDVANLGVSGYGTEQELKVIERYALPLEPRMVAWFFFEGNDLDDDQSFENAMMVHNSGSPPSHANTPVAVKWHQFLNRSFTRNAFMQLRQWSGVFIPNGVDSFGWFRDAAGMEHRFYFFDPYATRVLGEWERQRFEITKETLRAGAEIAKQHDIALVVYYVPVNFRVYGDLCTFPAGSPCPGWHPWDLESQFAAFCREAGIQFVSLTESMHKAAKSGELLYAPEDTHWNAAGHAFVAKQVAAAWATIASSSPGPNPPLH